MITFLNIRRSIILSDTPNEYSDRVTIIEDFGARDLGLSYYHPSYPSKFMAMTCTRRAAAEAIFDSYTTEEIFNETWDPAYLNINPSIC